MFSYPWMHFQMVSVVPPNSPRPTLRFVSIPQKANIPAIKTALYTLTIPNVCPHLLNNIRPPISIQTDEYYDGSM